MLEYFAMAHKSKLLIKKKFSIYETVFKKYVLILNNTIS